MKNRVLSNILAIGFSALIANTSAFAQQARQTATIPFSFEAGGVEYPEGDYMVARSTTNKVIVLTNLSSGRSTFVGAPILTGKADHGTSKLVFSHGADMHMRLNEVWFSGHPGMRTSPASKEVSARVEVGLK